MKNTTHPSLTENAGEVGFDIKIFMIAQGGDGMCPQIAAERLGVVSPEFPRYNTVIFWKIGRQFACFTDTRMNYLRTEFGRLGNEFLIFRVHAVRRMAERGISEKDIACVMRQGVQIKEYRDDTPYPSRLVLGWCGSRPLHVVAADDLQTGATIIITTYEPDPSQWDNTFRFRRES